MGVSRLTLPVNTEQFISHSRGSFALLRWAPVVGAAALPFTFGNGAISLSLAMGAIPVAAVWLISILFAWRTHHQHWLGLGFLAVVVGSRVVGVHGSQVPLSQGIQWLCLLVILAFVPLSIFRTSLLRFARLDEPPKIG